MAVIEAKSISMSFGSVYALNLVSFGINKGEIVGLLGPNGAGKTTAMRILTTYLVPTSGAATVGGYDILKNPLEIRKLVGYLPETSPLYQDMEVKEYLQFVGKSRALNSSLLKQRIDYVTSACELGPVFRRPILELSKGYKQRVGLAQSLIHDPEILILDEPTSGLDPMQILGIRSLIKNLVSKGKTIIFSTHIMQEVTAVTERVIIISEGKIVADDTIEGIRRKTSHGKRVLVVIASNSPEIEQRLKELDGQVRHENGVLKAEFRHKTGAEIFEMIKDTNWPVAEIRDETPSLEDAFVELVKASKK